jgi:hypothetical protein
MRLLLACLYALLTMGAANAADLLADVQARMQQPSLLRGQFEQQKNVVGFKRPLVSSGDFLLWREHGVLWHTKKPFDATLALRRDSLAVTQADGRAGYQMDAGREPGLRAVNEMLFALFSGDVATLQKHFHITGALSGKQEWSLQLTPASPALAQVFRRIELSGDQHVRRVKLEESNGDSSNIRFDQPAETPPASADEAARLGN